MRRFLEGLSGTREEGRDDAQNYRRKLSADDASAAASNPSWD